MQAQRYVVVQLVHQIQKLVGWKMANYLSLILILIQEYYLLVEHFILLKLPKIVIILMPESIDV